MYQTESPLIPRDNHVAIFLTTSATTGWFDWIHGELWLFPHGLLRVPLNLITTLLNSYRPTVKREDRPQYAFDDLTLQTLLASPKNVWVPRESIQKAYVHHGITTDRLRMTVRDRRSVTFLWLTRDGALPLLQGTLAEWLDSELIID